MRCRVVLGDPPPAPERQMRHLDLFSGIGGFALAARNMDWPTIGFCEIDEFCVGILRRRFASYRPDWLVIENVYHTWRRWMPELRRRLYERGYSSLPLRVSAASVGGVHHRARGWLVAHADSEQLRELSRWWSRTAWTVASELAESWDSAPRGLGANDGLPDWPHRRRALGNAVVPRAAELIFRGIAAMTLPHHPQLERKGP